MQLGHRERGRVWHKVGSGQALLAWGGSGLCDKEGQPLGDFQEEL